jgi:hypothetical protein
MKFATVLLILNKNELINNLFLIYLSYGFFCCKSLCAEARRIVGVIPAHAALSLDNLFR